MPTAVLRAPHPMPTASPGAKVRKQGHAHVLPSQRRRDAKDTRRLLEASQQSTIRDRLNSHTKLPRFLGTTAGSDKQTIVTWRTSKGSARGPMESVSGT